MLVDRHDPGRATDAGAGILSPETNRDRDPGFAAFGLTAAHHYKSLVARLADDGVTEVGFDVTGSLLVAERPGDDAFMDEAVRLVEERCPGLTEEIDPVEAARYFPPLGPVRRALLNPAARRVDGRVLNAALLEERRREVCERWRRQSPGSMLIGSAGPCAGWSPPRERCRPEWW